VIDIALIREKPEWVNEQIAKLNDPVALGRIDKIVELDKQRRALLSESEAIQAARNKLNKRIGQFRGNREKLDDERRKQFAFLAKQAINSGDYETAERYLDISNQPTLSFDDASLTQQLKKIDLDKELSELNDSLRGMGERVEALNEQIKQVESELDDNLLWIPNLPHDSVPVFDSEEHNIAWKPEGEFFEFDFEPKPHWELGPALDIIDFERGVKLAGSRAYVLKGWGARLQRALISLYLDMARDKGFVELNVPYFVREDMMVGAGQFPKFRDVVYFDPDADVYMLPTAEVAITNLHRDEILDESQLPLYYVAHTPCFRREKMSAGRDVRGIKRVHQFQKVEMYKFTSPETSYAELESLTEAASDVCRALKIPFRRLEIVTGDLGFSASKKYDIEVFSPGCNEWLEVSSCSNTEAFQARRANIKYRAEGQKRPQFVHTLNGSGLADTRVIIAIMENYQRADGSIAIPEALRPYMGGAEVITK
jgi:seryl-tRNA synthetase